MSLEEEAIGYDCYILLKFVKRLTSNHRVLCSSVRVCRTSCYVHCLAKRFHILAWFKHLVSSSHLIAVGVLSRANVQIHGRSFLPRWALVLQNSRNIPAPQHYNGTKASCNRLGEEGHSVEILKAGIHYWGRPALRTNRT